MMVCQWIVMVHWRDEDTESLCQCSFGPFDCMDEALDHANHLPRKGTSSYVVPFIEPARAHRFDEIYEATKEMWL